MANDFPYRALKLNRVDRFQCLYESGYINLEHDTGNNRRLAHCGRCETAVVKGDGRPYAELMVGGYRMTIRYLCPKCQKWADWLKESEGRPPTPDSVEKE